MRELKEIEVGNIVDCPYIIEDDGDGVASVEIVEQGIHSSYTVVKVVGTEQIISVPNDITIL